MVDITVLDKISINDIDIRSFRVSCQSDAVDQEGELNIIGVLFLKCPDGAKTKHNSSILPGYIHMKKINNLDEGGKTYHQKCFESICDGNIDDFLVLGFGVNYGLGGLKLNSSTFNVKLSNYLDKSNDREAMEFFTPILQTVMRKYKIEKCVGFTFGVEFIPLKIYSIYTILYRDKHLKYKLKDVHFETKDEFYSWCREYYKSDYNRNNDFESWFIKLDPWCSLGDMDFFKEFRIV